MEKKDQNSDLFHIVSEKALLKQKVYQNTYNTFQNFKIIIKKIVEEFQLKSEEEKQKLIFDFKDRGEFQIELKFAGDILLFVMHTNVFEFSRDHELMKTTYIRDDKKRSYCGIINIYNFLADSFKYNRINDAGYLIGRVFINKDHHYFIEGKKEIGLLYNNFPTAIMDDKAARKIVESAVLYTINFDLLTPPFDNVKEVSVYDMKTALDNLRIKTGKRLGFKFTGDHDEFLHKQ